MSKKDNIIIIDCQILQTTAFDRGMGKYTTSLLSALAKNSKFKIKFKKVFILLNKNLNTNKARAGYIQTLMPDSELSYLDLPIDLNTETKNKLVKATDVVTKFCEKLENYQGISYLVTAPFFVNFASVFPTQKFIFKSSIVYDFIPHRIWYKQKIFPDNLYYQHFQLLLEADRLFTISEFVKNDLINIFGFSESGVTTIDGGPFKQNVPLNINERPLNSKYIIYPSAPIVHKNNEIAVAGFAQFNKNKDYKLVITSSFDENTIKKLDAISNDIVFTGNISDEELYRYYEHAECLLFASISEGLGMPVLEATQHNIPIACSNIPVLSEISKNALYLFDPKNASSIANAIKDAVSKANFSAMSNNYRPILRKYSWERTAQILEDGLGKNMNIVSHKPKLKIITLPPILGAKQSRFIEYIYAQLNKHFDITIIYKKPIRKYNSVPSYVYYLDNKKIFSEKYDFMIIQKGSKFTFVSKQKTLDIKIRRRATHIWNENTIYIDAEISSIDNALGFTDWKYKLETEKNSNAEKIVNLMLKKTGIV